MKTSSAILAASMAVGLLFASSAPAVAGEAPKGQASVSYSDLDLSSAGGRTELARRYDQAARDMCGVEPSKKLQGKARFCYESTSKQLQMRVASILAKYDATGATAVAAR
jgi:UrcA family protein